MVLTTENLRCKLFVRAFFIVIFLSFDRKLLGTCENSTSRSTLCYNKSLSCSPNSLLSNVSDFECQMIWINNSSPDCNDDSFKSDGRISPEYTKMYLTSYLYKHNAYLIPAFNVSFTDIKWKRLRMRYVENKSHAPALCREFQISPFQNVPPNFTLFFDCLWHTTGIDRRVFRFQYKVITPDDDTYYYQYVFAAPDNNRIDEASTSARDWQLFMVVDVTEVPRNLSVRVQTVPDHFNISGYVVTLYRKMAENNSWPVMEWKPDHHTSSNKKFLHFYHETDSKPGGYYFKAKVKFPNGTTGYEAESPEITIVDMPEQIKLISVVGVVILVPILLAVYFMWRRKCYNKVQTPESVGPPKMLLMYNPVSIQHVRVMMEITRYLRSCRLLAMLDQFDIPQTEHRDPAQWYREAFDEADFVGIFASPITTAAEKEAVLKYTRYLHTEAIAMSQLRTKLVLPGARCKFFCISLPGTNWDTLPPEAQALKRSFPDSVCIGTRMPWWQWQLRKLGITRSWYTLPRDLDPLLVLVGLAPQCDHGAGFEKALEGARAPETPVTINVPQLPNHNNQASPPTPPTTPQESRQPNHHSQHHNSNDSSCCLDEAFSLSDQDLVSSSQPYLSDTGSRTSSLDQLSLLGE